MGHVIRMLEGPLALLPFTAVVWSHLGRPVEALSVPQVGSVVMAFVIRRRMWIAVVLICSFTDTHADLILAAAGAGKQIFCEKPVDLDLARARECAETVRKAGVTCLIGFQRRYDPTFSALKSRIVKGEIGTPEMLVVTMFVAATRERTALGSSLTSRPWALTTSSPANRVFAGVPVRLFPSRKSRIAAACRASTETIFPANRRLFVSWRYLPAPL